MITENLLKRITINPDIYFGKPTIRNMRYSVKVTLDLLASGMTESGILEDYPDLEIEDIRASLFFASRMMKVKSITHIKAA